MEDFVLSKRRKTFSDAASHSIGPESAITLLRNPQKPYACYAMSRLYGTHLLYGLMMTFVNKVLKLLVR